MQDRNQILTPIRPRILILGAILKHFKSKARVGIAAKQPAEVSPGAALGATQERMLS